MINPNKVMLTWSDEPGTQELHGRIMAMPAWVGGEWDVAGLKWIPSVPANLGRGLPRANAIVLLSDRETGLPVAVLDGTVISAMRTGAVTGVAIRHLARPAARTAGLLGAGVLTRTQLMALAATRPGLEIARVYDPNVARTEALLAELAPTLPFPVAVAHSEREACEGADIIIPSTLAVTPTIAKEWVPAGGLVVLVSSLDGPEDLHEVTDLLVVDDRDHEGTADTRVPAPAARRRHRGRRRRGRPGRGRLGPAPGPHGRRAAHRLLARGPRHGRRRHRRLRAAQRARARPRHVAAPPRRAALDVGNSRHGARTPSTPRSRSRAARVSISSPDKIFFKERGETKLDHVHYVIAVGEPLLRAIGGRPILMERYPDGASGKSFFQKRVPKGAPDWLQTVTVATVNGTESDALVAVDVAHLVWAVNLGCLGFHAWPTLASDPEHADELRIDLDPGPGVTFEMVRETAVEARALLAEHGLTGFAKTTGRRGIHIYCRLAPHWDSYGVRAAAVALARELERRRPELCTWAWWKEERGAARVRRLQPERARTRPCSRPGAPAPASAARCRRRSRGTSSRRSSRTR